MVATKYIAGDVHVARTELAVERNGIIINRFSVPTTIPALREILKAVARPKIFVIEEGCMSGWLFRNLRDQVDQMIVCDPRRNHYIAKDGDKDDPIDAAKLAELARGGFLREVYHSMDEDRTVFKEWVGIYHDRIREQTRQKNKIYAIARAHGVILNSTVFKVDVWNHWRNEFKDGELLLQLALLYKGYLAVAEQVKVALREITKRSKKHDIIGYWQELPGIGVVRASTLFAYLDTPWRFKKRSQLCKYCGLGLERSTSGTDKKGRPNKGSLHLAWQVNRRLKDAIMGATTNVIVGDNPFGYQYRSLLKNGITPDNAKHTVARKLLAVLWGMWKRNERFDSQLL
jgi:transposase